MISPFFSFASCLDAFVFGISPCVCNLSQCQQGDVFSSYSGSHAVGISTVVSFSFFVIRARRFRFHPFSLERIVFCVCCSYGVSWVVPGCVNDQPESYLRFVWGSCLPAVMGWP